MKRLVNEEMADEGEMPAKKYKPSRSWNEISSDGWFCVLSFMETRKLILRYSFVCREWRELVMERLPLCIKFRDIKGWLTMRLCRLPSNIVSLSIRGPCVYSEAGVKEDLEKLVKEESLYYNVGLMTNLEKFSITYLPEGKGELRHLAQLKKLRHIDLSGSSVNEGHVEELINVDSLTSLDVSNSEASPAWFVKFSKFKHLQNLIMQSVRRRDRVEEYFQYPSGFENLRQLSVSIRSITDAANKSLFRLSSLSQLTHLDLSYNCLKDLSLLSRMKGLTYLNLHANFIESQHCTHLSDLVNLTKLKLTRNRLDGKCFGYLSNLTNLVHLDLRDNNIHIRQSSTTHIQSLNKLVKLQFLNLNRSLSINGKIEQSLDLPELTYLCISDYHGSVSDLFQSANLMNLTYLQADPYTKRRYFGSNQDLDESDKLVITLGSLGKRGLLPSLQKMHLEGTTPEYIHFLKPLENLVELSFSNCVINTKVADSLNKLTRLKSIRFCDCSFSGRRREINLPNLTTLELRMPCTDHKEPIEICAKHLGNFERLTKLIIVMVSLNDATMDFLNKLKNLEILELLCCDVNGSKFLDLPKLRILKNRLGGSLQIAPKRS